ncbi:MAG: helix-turn-helix domain-containing protein [Zoogloeaceae bacterium]|jgi:excisionase family DNA binding protein|nr:helix-turn-helix domain-containing protein [Zoogloeaceae bacterium]
MAQTLTAEELYQDLRQMPPVERQRFFVILSANAFGGEDLSHEQLFGHLAGDEFTAQEAAEYLEVSMSTFRRIVTDGRLTPSSTVGRNQMFAVPDLKAFKKAQQRTRSRFN